MRQVLCFLKRHLESGLIRITFTISKVEILIFSRMSYMHKTLSSLLLLTIATPLMAAGVHRGGAELLNPSAYSFNSSAMVFNTSSFYDTAGVEEELTQGNAYRLIDMDLAVSYGVSSSLELSAMGRFRQVSSTVGEEVTENSGLESLGVEAKYAFARIGNLRYAIGVHYRQTLYTNENYADTSAMPAGEIVLGDSGSEYGVDLFMTYAESPWKIDGKFGYSSPARQFKCRTEL